MKKSDVADFFDRCAPWWDDDMVRNEEVITRILDNGGITQGTDVLDVACGTGVLFPDYMARRVRSITAIDISPKMAEIAAKKFPSVSVICGDVETYPFNRTFDSVMVYNAFPHFPDSKALIEVLSRLVSRGGTLSVAHGMSRNALIEHHKRAENVSVILPEAAELAELFKPYFEVTTLISNDEMYQVSGIRK